MGLRKSIRIASFILFVILLVLAVVRLWPVIMPFFLAVLFAYLLQPLVSKLEKLEVDKGAAIIVIYAYFFILLTGVVALCVPILSSQFANLFRRLPQLLQQTQVALNNAVSGTGSAFMRDLAERLTDTVADSLYARISSVFEDSAALIAVLLRAALYTLLTPFLAYYILRDHGSLGRTVASWLPVSERGELKRLAEEIDHLLRQFVRGYLLVSIIVALLAAAFYLCIDLDDALALGMIMGVADIIPYFGPFIGAIPAVAVALSVNTGKAVITAVGLTVIQQLESIVITPRIMGDKIGLHPLATIMAVLAGGLLFGVLGTILAVPATAAGLLIIRYLWARIVGAKIN